MSEGVTTTGAICGINQPTAGNSIIIGLPAHSAADTHAENDQRARKAAHDSPASRRQRVFSSHYTQRLGRYFQGRLPLGCCFIGRSLPTDPSSRAGGRRRLASPIPQRVSSWTLPPSVQPNCRNPSRNAARRACDSASSASEFISTPTRRIGPGC
jgi:hypothetical protein